MDAPEGHFSKDPLEVHRENMKLLKVLPVSGNRSAPNSPMVRRATEKTVTNTKFLSPSPNRRDFKEVTDDNRSQSWTQIAGNNSPNLSPKGSPIGSPMTVSEKIIRTHFLSNTTGKAGSYLLQKSDDIIKQKESPTGSPRMPLSPNVMRKGDIATVQTRTQNHNKSNLLTPASIPVIVSPDPTSSKVGFVPGNTDAFPKVPSSHAYASMRTENQQLEDDETDEEERHIKDVRQSIGTALRKSKAKTIPPKNEQTNESNSRKKTELTGQPKRNIIQPGSVKKAKPRRHQYIKYGNTDLSPGYLSPPTEPRGSKDLSAEMEIWERKERRLFEDLDNVDEVSSISPSDEGETSLEEKKVGFTGVFTMPPVSENVAHVPEARNFSFAPDVQGDIDDETWEEIKRCRYLRLHEDENEEVDLNDSENDDDDEDDDSEDPPDAK